MEELLNKLIEKGWKPRGKNYGVVDFLGTLVFVDLNDGRLERKNALDLRKLTSKESGLWQFCIANGMLNKKRWSNRVRLETSSSGDYIEIWTGEDYGGKFDSDYEYRLIESALCDEDKLESFILDNIKIDE